MCVCVKSFSNNSVRQLLLQSSLDRGRNRGWKKLSHGTVWAVHMRLRPRSPWLEIPCTVGKTKPPLQMLGRGRRVQRIVNKALEGRKEPKRTRRYTGETETARAASGDQKLLPRRAAPTATRGSSEAPAPAAKAAPAPWAGAAAAVPSFLPPPSVSYQYLLLAECKCRPAGKGVWKM